MEDVNRIKLVLVEKKRTSKWLAEQLGVSFCQWRYDKQMVMGNSDKQRWLKVYLCFK